MPSYVEVLRRVYHDVVKRRASVRVVPASDVELVEPPIFLIGAYRSGTTLLRYVLDSHSRICCPPESDFLGALSCLLEDTGKGRMYRSRLAAMGFDDAHVAHKLRELAQYFFGNYAASVQKPRWADKSPSYVDYLDFLLRLFPEAQLVMIYRHGLDQAHSYTRGGTFMRDTLQPYCRPGEDMRLGAVRYWQEKVAKMRAFEETHASQCFRIQYEDLCRAPEEQLKPMFAFFSEPWEPQVLEFYRFAHDIGAEDGRVAATRGFSLSASHYLSWPPELVSECAAIAEPGLSALGYSI